MTERPQLPCEMDCPNSKDGHDIALSRELKFRAWDANICKMSSIELGPVLWDISALKGDAAWLVMQYTGLNDDNGVEIYEGDIVASPHFTDAAGRKHKLFHLVQWSSEYHGWFLLSCHSRNPKDGSIQLFVARHTSLEVVGNIYQNPELIAKHKEPKQ